MIYKETSWNKHDLISCAQAAEIILREYGQEELLQLDAQGAFGSFDVYSLLENPYHNCLDQS